MDRAGWKHINLLQIDTEGYDLSILKQCYASQIFPDVINLESRHLKAEHDRKLCGIPPDIGAHVVRRSSSGSVFNSVSQTGLSRAYRRCMDLNTLCTR